MFKKTRKTVKTKNEKQTDNLPVKTEGQTSAKSEIQKSEPQKHKHHAPAPVAEILVNICQNLIKKSIFLLVPWVLFSVGILMTGSYLIFKEFFIGMAYPFWYLALIAFLLFGVYGFLGFVYGLTMALLHTLLAASSSMGDIIKKTVLRVKNSIESQVDRFADTLEQKNILTLISKTFEDISKNIRRYAAKTAAGLLIVAFLGGVLFLIKNVMITSFKKVKNKGEFFTKMSVRFTLILAIILNLKFFTKIALVLGYLVGILLVLSQVVLWQIMQ